MASDDPQALAFACLHCGRILEFMADPPLQEQTVSEFAQLPTPAHLDDEFKVKERKALDNLLDSFVVVPSQPRKQEGQGWDKRIQALTKLFEIASDKCQLDHPLCRDCSDELLKELDGRIRELQQDNAAYAQRLDELNRGGPGRSSAEQEAMEKAELEKEEQLKAQLMQLRQEREAIRQERIQLDKEEKNLSQFETRFWQEYQDFQRDLAVINDEMQTYTQRLENSKEQLERMKRTNVLDDAFHIYYDGHFGTINGFRLGRLPSQPVDWVETNAAFGQVVLLLHTIAKQSKYTFQKYRLHPLGSFSKVSKIDGDNTAYELYGSNDLNISRLFWYRRFDTALVWLLECIAEFGEHASKIDPSFRLKYPIRGENIDGISVKLQFNQDAKWTKALKYMLTNLKFILAWVSKHQDH